MAHERFIDTGQDVALETTYGGEMYGNNKIYI